MNEQNPIEAELVPTQLPATVPKGGEITTISELEQSFALAVRQRDLLSDYIKKQLKPGKHFYEVRGQTKKSLTKEGAEIILLPHGYVPDYDMVSGPQAPPEGESPYQITVKCTLRRKGYHDSFVGSGIGSAGSHKGTWKNERWVYQPRQNDKFLCHNATLKMAQKSAMIAATINSTAASEFFTQDMSPEEQNAPGTAPETPPPSDATPVVPTPPSPLPARSSAASEAYKAKFIENLLKGDLRQAATVALIDWAWLMPNETLEDLKLKYVPVDKKEYADFLGKVSVHATTGKADRPYQPHDDEPRKPEPQSTEDDAWRSFPMTHGKHAGEQLCELDKAYLYGLWANFTPEKTFKAKDGTMKPVSDASYAKAVTLRKMLNDAGKHYNFTKRD